VSLEDAVHAIRPSVVQLSVRAEAGRLPRTLGTGFIVDERGTIVTALHVVKEGVRFAQSVGHQGRPQFVAGLAHPQLFEAGGKLYGMQGFSYVDVDLLSVVPDHDLCAARLKENVVRGEWDPELVPVIDGTPVPPLAGVATLDTRRPREGATVAVSGYPFAMNSLITNSGCIASAFLPNFADDAIPDPPPQPPDEGRTPGAVRMVETFTPGPSPGERYLADLEVNGGNSGGPVYYADTGAVIGMCIATRQAAVTRGGRPVVVGGQVLTYSSGLTVVVPAIYVDAMLRERRVSS
jgi:hypothetical protein